MTLNPYSMLLVTGVLMVATVVITAGGPSLTLAEAGAKSMNRDISSFAAQVVSKVDLTAANSRRLAGDGTAAETRMASLQDREPEPTVDRDGMNR